MSEQQNRAATAAELDEMECYLRGLDDLTLFARWADAIAALRRERDEARDKAETNACKANRLEEANAQMAAALRELHEAVKAVAPHFEAPVTSENVGLWQRLDAAQKTAATLPASPSPEPEPFGADVGRERLDAPGAGLWDAASLLQHYADYIRTVPSGELETHPYLPKVEDAVAFLRALAAKGGDHEN